MLSFRGLRKQSTARGRRSTKKIKDHLPTFSGGNYSERQRNTFKRRKSSKSRSSKKSRRSTKSPKRESAPPMFGSHLVNNQYDENMDLKLLP